MLPPPKINADDFRNDLIQDIIFHRLNDGNGVGKGPLATLNEVIIGVHLLGEQFHLAIVHRQRFGTHNIQIR